MDSTTAERPTVAFISGMIEPPDDWLTMHYAPRLQLAIEQNHHFVVGPAPGVDSEALEFLLQNGVPPSNITVYMAEFQERTIKRRLQSFISAGGKVKVEGLTTGDRDAAMTRDSDYDILKYMTVEEAKIFYGRSYYPRVTNTEKNERRRNGLALHHNEAFNASSVVNTNLKTSILPNVELQPEAGA